MTASCPFKKANICYYTILRLHEYVSTVKLMIRPQWTTLVAPRQIRCTKESKNGWPQFIKFYRYTFCIWRECIFVWHNVFYRYKNRAMSEKPSADLGANWILRRGPRRPLSAATKLTVLLLLMLGNHRGTVEACMLSLSVHEQSLSSQSKAGSSACVVPFLAVTTASKTLVTPIDSFF